jgi:hypothetical protein
VLSDHFDGEVLTEMMTSPFATSELIAENMLLRNEHQWARLLNQSDLNDGSEVQILCAGLSAEPDSEYLVASERVRLTLVGIKSVRNFCAYGHRVDSAAQSHCRITVMVNNLQKKIFDVTNNRSFILNIEDPLLLQDCDNNFNLSIDQTPNLV